MKFTVRADDERVLEVLVSDLPWHHLPVCANSSRPHLAQCSSRFRSSVARDKERKYGELLEGGRCHLVVVIAETGGRWSQEACEFVNSTAAARARARGVPPILRRSAHLAWQRGCMRTLVISCGKAFAASLVSSREDAWTGTERRSLPLPSGVSRVSPGGGGGGGGERVCEPWTPNPKLNPPKRPPPSLPSPNPPTSPPPPPETFQRPVKPLNIAKSPTPLPNNFQKPEPSPPPPRPPWLPNSPLLLFSL